MQRRVSFSWRLGFLFLLLGTKLPSLHGQILTWDTHEVLPGTELITLGPGLDFSSFNSEALNLSYGDFSGEDVDISNSNFATANVRYADFSQANVAGANVAGADLHHAILDGANFSMVNWTGTNLFNAQIEGTDLSGAIGLTAAQLYSSANYQAQELSSINRLRMNLSGNAMTGWNFSGIRMDGIFMH
ncbi:MAG: pentapeptide repeat-containing protein, partial [Planctomycetales bacterium]|nr:pentapeptide repeat-containing protein [Planctomycetales bacterium]